MSILSIGTLCILHTSAGYETQTFFMPNTGQNNNKLIYALYTYSKKMFLHNNPRSAYKNELLSMTRWMNIQLFKVLYRILNVILNVSITIF